MKLMQIAVALSLFAFSNANSEVRNRHNKAFVPPQPRQASPGARPESRQIRVITDQEISQALGDLEKEAYSIQKLAAIRHLIMRSRRSKASEASQTKFNTFLEEAHKNYNKNDRREVCILRSVLNMSQQSPLLSENDKENIKTILGEIVDNSGENERNPMSIKTINNIKAKDNYNEKVCSLQQIMRRPRIGGNIDKNMQSETSSAIHDLYAQRPLNNVALLSKLRDVLSVAQNTPLLSTINQYEVKEIMLPEVSRNFEKAALAAKNLAANKPQSQGQVTSVKTVDIAKIA